MNGNNTYSRRSKILNEIQNNNEYKKLINDLRSEKYSSLFYTRDKVSKIILEKFGNKMEEVAPTRNFRSGNKQIQWSSILTELGLTKGNKKLEDRDIRAICRKLSQLFLNKKNKKINVSSNVKNDENYSMFLNTNFKNKEINNMLKNYEWEKK